MAPVDVARRRPAAPAPNAPAPTHLVAQLGSEVAATLSAALERVQVLASTGRIDRAGLRALRDEIDRARRLGMMGQQIGRFADGRVPLSPEPLDLTALLRETLLQRGREIQRRGLDIRQQLQPAVVIVDATLVFSLLQTLLDWAFEHACSRIELEIDRKPWPAHARLSCSFAWLPVDEQVTGPMPLDAVPLDTMSWHALTQVAHALGLPMDRDDGPGRTRVTLEFPRTVAEALEQSLVVDGHVSPGVPLQGAHVLVVAARREVRHLVRDALKVHGVMLDFVTSVDEAREFCRSATPHAVVHEAALGGENLERLRRDLLGAAPRTGFVQVTEDERPFELKPANGYALASLGRAAIRDSLAPALMFALSR